MHPGHHVRPIDLDRPRADAEIVSDDLVRLAFNKPLKDFPKEDVRTFLKPFTTTFREMEATLAPIAAAPGSLAKACRRLADAGVNIEALMPTGMEGDHVTVAFITGDPAKARQILTTAGSAAG